MLATLSTSVYDKFHFCAKFVEHGLKSDVKPNGDNSLQRSTHGWNTLGTHRTFCGPKPLWDSWDTGTRGTNGTWDKRRAIVKR